MLGIGLPDLGDPLGWAIRLTVGLVGRFLDGARGDISQLLDRYLFTTVDTAGVGGGPLTANPTLQRLNGTLVAASDILLTAVILFASFRSMFERSLRARYSLRVVLPRLLLAVVLVHGSLFLMQMAIDLNNALGHVAVTMGALNADSLPWSASISAQSIEHLRVTEDLFRAVFAVAVVIALVILGLAYVIRTSLLNILIVVAPLACLCTVLPDTRSYAHTWLHLFLTTVFMQAVQLMILGIASSTALDSNGGLAQSIYSLATLFILLKVPGALNTASHLQTKAKTLGHRMERSMSRALQQGQRTRRTT